MLDTILVAGILVVDLFGAWIGWQSLQEKRKQRIARQVSRLLRTLREKTFAGR